MIIWEAWDACDIDEFVCYVESFTEHKGRFSSRLVQKIRMDQSRFEAKGLKPVWGCPNWVVDKERRHLWAFSAIKRTIVSVTGPFETNRYLAVKFRLPRLSEGSEVVLTADDVLDEAVMEFDAYATQGGTMRDGKIYYAGLYYIGGTKGYDCDGGIFDNLNDYRSWYNSVKTSGTSTPLTSLTEPFTVWGSSVSTVQSNMTGYTLEIGSAGKAEALGSGSYYIAYSAKAPVFAIYYTFSSQTTGLNESDVFYYKSSASQDQILQLLNRKYTYIMDNEGTYFYMTNNGESYVVLMDLDDYWSVGYVDPSILSGSSAPAFESMKQEIKGRIHKILPSLTKAEKVVSTLSISDNVKDKRLCRIK